MCMDRFYIITNSLKDKELLVTKKIKNYLLAHGKSCMIQEEKGLGKRQKYRFTDADLIPEETQCIIVVGGDGTLIQAARDTIDKQIPLLGVNLGTLGYLTAVETHNTDWALDNLMMDKYYLEKRMMIKGRAYRGSMKLVEDIALNDIVIGRYGHIRMVNFKIYVNGEFLHSYDADGIIVSTATGSTGYSLSVGGPIVAPHSMMILVTPVAPHTLNSRSIVLSSHDKIEIEVGEGRKLDEEEVEVAFDGDAFMRMVTGDRLIVEKADKDTKLLKISHTSFLQVLREKIGNS
jgi:Predicted sugar kinase